MTNSEISGTVVFEQAWLSDEIALQANCADHCAVAQPKQM